MLVAAGKEPADVFAHTVRDHVNERSAGEGLEERRRRQRARREANIKKESDGMYKLFGTFDPVAGARIETALAATAKKLRHGEDAQATGPRPPSGTPTRSSCSSPAKAPAKPSAPTWW